VGEEEGVKGNEKQAEGAESDFSSGKARKNLQFSLYP
jgi:hypothetical protein